MRCSTFRGVLLKNTIQSKHVKRKADQNLVAQKAGIQQSDKLMSHKACRMLH